MYAWALNWSAFASIKVLHPRTERRTNLAKSFQSDAIIGTRFATGCQLVSHDQKNAEQTAGLISVHRLLDGFATMEFPELCYVHRPGHITITDYSQPYRGSHHRAVGEGLMISRHDIGLADLQPFSPIIIAEDSENGRRMVDEMKAFFDARARDEAYNERGLADVLRAVFLEHSARGSDREEWWRSRQQLIRKYIETHLEDPNLGPLQICNLFNMSRATLYRMFETDGGVRRFIQDRRLCAAIWDLAQGGIKRGRLSRVAERWGFSSDANFNRAAKLAFGMPPGAFFKQRVPVDLKATDKESVQHAFLDWFKGRNIAA